MLKHKQLPVLSQEDVAAALQRRADWIETARPDQLPPDTDFEIWMLLGGRGSGKTRSGAEETVWRAIRNPGWRIAVVAPTESDIRDTCFEGDSGILSVLPPSYYYPGCYVRSLTELTLPNGSIIKGFSSVKPERLRGPQFHFAWCFVAGTKVSTPSGPRDIESIEVGDVVHSSAGPARVYDSGFTGVRPVYRLTTDDGRVLEGTDEHPIWVEGKGWTPLTEIQPCDIVMLHDEEQDTWPAETTSSTEAPSTTSCQTGTSEARIKASAKGNSFIERCGETSEDPYLRTGTSTTKTGLLSLRSIRTTLSACLIRTTPGSTIAKLRTSCDRVLRNATYAARNFKQRFTTSFSAALSAAERILDTSMIATCAASASGATGTSLTPAASPVHPAPCGSGSARGATGPFLRSDITSGTAPSRAAKRITRVTKVEFTGTSLPVYNLSVEGSHDYYANGILVHNCDELCAWENLEETLDMLNFCLRLGENPQKIVTTTPKPTPMIRVWDKKSKEPGSKFIITRSSTYDNKDNLAKGFFSQITQYEGTQLGRQEIHAEILDPEESGIIKRSWLGRWPAKAAAPRFDFIILSLDTAFTEKTFDEKKRKPDPTACTVWGAFQNPINSKRCVMLLDAWQDHLGFDDLLVRAKKEMDKRYGEFDVPIVRPLFGKAFSYSTRSAKKPDAAIIEDKGSGISLRQSMVRLGFPVWKYNPGRASKLERVHLVSHWFNDGRVWIPESRKKPGQFADWAEPFVEQLCSYSGPGTTTHDDFIDTATQAIRVLADRGTFRYKDVDDEKRDTSARRLAMIQSTQVANPYDC